MFHSNPNQLSKGDWYYRFCTECTRQDQHLIIMEDLTKVSHSRLNKKIWSSLNSSNTTHFTAILTLPYLTLLSAIKVLVYPSRSDFPLVTRCSNRNIELFNNLCRNHRISPTYQTLYPTSSFLWKVKSLVRRFCGPGLVAPNPHAEPSRFHQHEVK